VVPLMVRSVVRRCAPDPSCGLAFAAALLACGCTLPLEGLLGDKETTSVPIEPPVGSAAGPDYDNTLEAIRKGECWGLGARVGTCGQWLVIIQHHIDTALTSYFDPQTRRLVAQHWFDVSEEYWLFGHVDCNWTEFTETEYIVCNGPPHPSGCDPICTAGEGSSQTSIQGLVEVLIIDDFVNWRSETKYFLNINGRQSYCMS